jgi:HAD superfamily hydrolase (TIGR01509 family)
MDFNGVVIDDEAVQMRAYQQVLDGEGIALSDADYYSSLGMDDRTFVAAAYERVGKKVDSEKIDHIVTAKSAKWKEAVSAELPLFPGIEDFIEKMSREFAMGIVSMSKLHEIEFVLERSGLGKYFSAIVSADDVSSCKPAPECYRIGFGLVDDLVIARGNSPLTHEECLAIEDSPPGIVSARAADLQALGVTNTVEAEELRRAGARAVASDLRDWTAESVRLVFDYPV